MKLTGNNQYPHLSPDYILEVKGQGYILVQGCDGESMYIVKVPSYFCIVFNHTSDNFIPPIQNCLTQKKHKQAVTPLCGGMSCTRPGARMSVCPSKPCPWPDCDFGLPATARALYPCPQPVCARRPSATAACAWPSPVRPPT